MYTLREEDFEGIEGFGDKKISNFLDQVAQARTMTAVELVARLGIPMVQKKALSRLGIVSLQDFLDFHDDDYVIGKRIVDWKGEPGNMEFLNSILDVVEIREGHSPEERRGVICLTGSAPIPRKALTSALEERGWTVAGAVTRDTIKLICDDPSGNSTKLKKARETGIEILSYDDFLASEGIEFGE